MDYFGQAENGIIKLSQIGRITEEYWKNIPAHFPCVKLGEFVVMPNHMHGIIVINPVVETQNLASLQNNKFGPQSRNLGSIIRGFKIGGKKWVTLNNADTFNVNKNQDLSPRHQKNSFQWQPGFYDHIIRNEKSLQNIRQYIMENPLKWEFDLENPECRNVESYVLTNKE